MNAPFRPILPETLAAARRLRERTPRQQADVLLNWHPELIEAATRTDWGAADFERSASAAHMAAERMADTAREELDMDNRIVMWCCVGRYALKARVCRARAKELRAAEQ